MSDLVTELRAEADYHGQAVRVGSDKEESTQAAHLEELLNRGAAEIERLTAALASAHNWLFCAAEEVGGSHLVATHGENPEGLARGIMEQYAAVEAALASEREANEGPGTPMARLNYLLDELERLFPVAVAHGIASAIRARGKEI